jgi:uncharacterized membrane protein SirB2
LITAGAAGDVVRGAGWGGVVLALYYQDIKWLHIGCVAMSGSLFAFRGFLVVCNSERANNRGLARASYVIDSALLGAAILLTVIIHQYPLLDAWLTVKVALLVFYIVLGILALRRGKTRRLRIACFAAALLVYGFIISVAVSHDPRGLFSQISSRT